MVIAIASGKGGTGKTILSTSLALSAGDCLYADLDVEEPNGVIFLSPNITEDRAFAVPVPHIDTPFCTFCGKCADACVFNAIAIIPAVRSAKVFDDLCHGCGVCAYVCPIKDAIQENRREIGRVRAGIRGTTGFIEGRLRIGIPSAVPLISHVTDRAIQMSNLVILDSSPGTSCNMVESVRKSDYIILVTEPTPFGLHDLKLAVQVAQELGKPCGIIINKSLNQDRIIEDFCAEQTIEVLLKIPYSLDIQRAYADGIPMVEALPEMKSILRNMVGKIVENQ